MSLPASLVTMVGRAGPTLVWHCFHEVSSPFWRAECVGPVGGPGQKRSAVVDVSVEMIGPDLVDDRTTEVADRTQETGPLVRRQPAQDRPHPVLLERFDLVADPGSFGGRLDDDDPAVICNP